MKNIDRREFMKNSCKLTAGLAVLGLGANAVFANANSKENTNAMLPTRILGKNFKISALGLGCMGMSANHGPAKDIKEMTKLLHQAIELGVTYFDTAEIYGPHTNEELLGNALKPYRNKIAIGTKFGLYYPFGKQMQDSTPKAIRRAVEASLKRLQTDYIDIYTQHRVDPDIDIQVVANVMADLVKEGKIRHYGLSEPSAKTIQRAQEVYPITAVQSQYSMAFREPETNNVFDVCQNLGIGFVAYSPLDRGFLTGVMDEKTTFHPTLDMRSSFPRYTKEALKANQVIIKFIDKIAETKKVDDKKATIAQISLAWILAQRDFIVPIPETTKLKHLKENLGALKISFTSKELQEINSELSKIKLVGDRYAPNSDAARSVGL